MMTEEDPKEAVPEASPEMAVPEASPEANDKEEAKAAPASRRYLYIGLGILLAIVIVLCIALPLALKDSSSNEVPTSSSTSESQNSESSTNSTPEEVESRAPDGGDASNVFDADGVGGAGAVGGSLPAGSGGSLTLLASELPLFGKDITEGYASPLELEASLAIAFRNQAQSIIRSTMQQYAQQQEWEAMRESEEGGGDGSFPSGPPPPPPVAASGEMMEDQAVMSMTDTAGGAGAASEGVTDFETNNQEENVDEADMIKADANFVYGAYGDYILIWDTAGNKVAQVAMPPIDLPDNWGKPPTPVAATESKLTIMDESKFTKSMIAPNYHYTPKPRIQSMLLTDDYLVAAVNGYGADYSWGVHQEYMDGDRSQETKRVLYDYRGCQIRLYQKTATGNLTFVGSKDVNGHFVDARSIGDTVHLATATGVDTYTHLQHPLDRWMISNGTEITNDRYAILAMQKADQIVGPLAKKLAGELQTTDGILPTLLQVNQWFTQVNDTDTHGPGFDIPMYQSYDVASNVAQVTSFEVGAALTADNELTTSASAYLAPSYFNTLYGTQDHLVLATSGWDWNPLVGESEQTTYLVALETNGASTSFLSVGTLKGHLLNNYALDIVGNELRAATTVQRNTWWWWGGRPMMMVDDVDFEDVSVTATNAQATVEVSGAVEATAEDPEGLCPLISDGDADCMNDENRAECLALVAEGCTLIDFMESCPLQFACADDPADPTGLCPDTDDECVDADNRQVCLELVLEGCDAISVDDSCPYSFACDAFSATASTSGIASEPDVFFEPPPPPPQDESRTENYMIVMTLDDPNTPSGLMSEKGRVKIGEINEVITAVRFFDNVAYAVTFERTDPLYVLDMSVPAILGELKVPGFSSYLHSMNADNTLLLAVGQNATEDGQVTGLMVTVFDAQDASNPQALVSHTFEQDTAAHSSSSIQWDYKAFRYVAGKLIIPVEIYYYQQWNQTTQQLDPLPEDAENFQGFAVLDVNTTSITEEYRISHMKPEGACHYCDRYLPRRSFVYAGDLMTVDNNMVVSTGLESGREVWRLNLTIDGEVAECCW